jgi:hypothetical protein
MLLPATSNPTASPKSTERLITNYYRRERGIPNNACTMICFKRIRVIRAVKCLVVKLVTPLNCQYTVNHVFHFSLPYLVCIYIHSITNGIAGWFTRG